MQNLYCVVSSRLSKSVETTKDDILFEKFNTGIQEHSASEILGKIALSNHNEGDVVQHPAASSRSTN